jgi:hypothetical protein
MTPTFVAIPAKQSPSDSHLPLSTLPEIAHHSPLLRTNQHSHKIFKSTKHSPVCKARSFIQTSNIPAASATLSCRGISSFCRPSVYAFTVAVLLKYGLLGTGCVRSRASRSSRGTGKSLCVEQIAPRTAPRAWRRDSETKHADTKWGEHLQMIFCRWHTRGADEGWRGDMV